MSAKNSERLYQVFIYVVVGLLVLVSLFPLVYAFAMSFASEDEVYRRGYLMIIPYEPTLSGYRQILLTTDTYIKGFGISVLRTVVGTFSTLTCTMVLGYLLSKRDLPGRKLLLFAVMVTVLYGAGLIPSFMTVKNLGFVDSFWVYIIPGLVDSWSVLVFRQTFEGLPQEVIESAYMDGCGEFRMFLGMALPMSVPTISALGLFTAVGQWNAWFDAMVYIQKRKELYPLQLLLRNVLQGTLTTTNKEGSIDLHRVTAQTPTSVMMVIVVIGTVPILCVYPFLQKHFTSGMYMGAVKG